MKKDIAGEIIKLKDNSEVKLVYDLKEIKKINPKQVKEWQNEHANEYTYNNQTTPWTLKLTNEKFKQRINSIEKKDAIAVYVFNKDKLIADIGISRKDHRRNHSAGLGITVLKDYRIRV
jgi:RimJ/RimL family protein N-acetyltransferase